VAEVPAAPADPFAVLGLTRSATLTEVRNARRRLAMGAHPDRGGDAALMQQINGAFDAAVAHLTGRRPLPEVLVDPPARPARRTSPSTGRRDVQVDAPSFTIDALPAEAFEALLVVTSWMGEVLVDDPPYLLEVVLHDPAPCWCRLDLVPEAGASTVSLTVAAFADAPVPDAEDVRDLWVANLNGLGAP
jgi:hypothetical protein